MRVLAQRVSHASVTVDDRVTGQIDHGLLLFVGIGAQDGEPEVRKLAQKVAHLRIFSDRSGKFAHSLLEVGGGALVVSQFTLYAVTRKGRRPSFSGAAPPDQAEPLVEQFMARLRELGVARVEAGVFGAAMAVSLCNQGPVTIWLDSDDMQRK